VRILSLHLTAFGPFTDATLSFPEGNGLHIVYGPNEAGKSTALRALKALFFGIPERTADNFLHDNKDLRVGGRIQRDGGPAVHVVRRKGRKDTLLDEEERPLPEEVLRGVLGPVGEELFSRMFGISHADLVRGGQEIVAGKGDVGESLFAAGMGGAGLKDVLAALDEEADRLFKPRGQKQAVNEHIAAFREAKGATHEATLHGKDWEEKWEALGLARSRKEELSRELAALKADLSRLERIVHALPLIGERKECLARRASMGSVLILPPGFSEERVKAATELERARTAAAKAAAQLESVRQKLDALPPPGAVLAQESVITELHKTLGGPVKAASDLPSLQGEAARLSDDAERLLKELSPGLTLAQAEKLRLPVSKRQRVLDLAARHQELQGALSRAKRTAEGLWAKIDRTQGDIGRLGLPRDGSTLREAVRRLQKQGSLDDDLAEAVRGLAAEEEQARVDLLRLPLWERSLEALEAAPVPASDTIDRFEAAFAGLAARRDGIDESLRKAREKAADLEQRIARLESAGDVPTEEDLDRARRRREAGWKLVREAWLDGQRNDEGTKAFDPEAPLPEAFEKSVREADAAADRLRREADRVAQKNTWLADLKAVRDEIAAHSEERNKILREESDLNEQWRAQWTGAGIEPLPPKEMRPWIARQAALVARAETIRTRRQAVKALETRIQGGRDDLLRGLASLSEPPPPDQPALQALLDRGQSVLDAQAESDRRREALQNTLADISEQLAAAGLEEKEAAKWQGIWNAEWAEAVKDLPLDASAHPREVNAFLERSQDLFGKIDTIADRTKRIAGIERDRDAFAEWVRVFAARVAPDLADLPYGQVVELLHKRLSDARQAATERDGLLRQAREREDELAAAWDAIAELSATLDSLCRRAHCDKPEDLEEAERRSAAAQALDQNIASLNAQLLAFTGGGTIDDLVAEADAEDADALPGRIVDARARTDGLAKEISDLDQAIGSARTEIARMDGSAKATEAAERAQAALSRIREATERYVRLRLAASLLRGEIERYRERNQGPVLKRASEIFSRLTLGSFAGLKTHYDDGDRPVLVGTRSSGETVGVEGMSDGTCDQLYLALRLASLEHYLAANEPMPFIVDDILVNFDNERAKAALDVLADLAGRTQVIFFTHHRHLVNLCGGSPAANVLSLEVRLPSLG
jgi:uncharacterized protein YhaN